MERRIGEWKAGRFPTDNPQVNAQSHPKTSSAPSDSQSSRCYARDGKDVVKFYTVGPDADIGDG
jgi:hypothetical protein